MKAPGFAYLRAESLGDVFAAFEAHGADAQILAGGQSLMATLALRLSDPRVLVDINGLDELSGIAETDGMVRIGALVRHAELARAPLIAERLPLIAEAVPHIAHFAIRNRGTMGGSIALADPAAELPACALAYGAEIVLAGRRGRRSVKARDFFLGLYETARADDEIVAEIRVPIPAPGERSGFVEYSRRHGDFAVVGVACRARLAEDRAVEELSLVVFGSEPCPTLAGAAAARAIGRRLDGSTVEAVAAALADELDPMEDLGGGRAYKLHLSQTLAKRALACVSEAP